jgi:Fe-S-cluster containining protein
MEQYLKERSMLFNAWFTFSCPDSCERVGCKIPNLRILLSLVDFVAIFLISGRKASEFFTKDIKIGFGPLQENNPWIGRVSLALDKLCHFLNGKLCSVYSGRPIACALFPEFHFMGDRPETILQKEIFQNFPCIQNPCFISPRRKATLQQLWEMSAEEVTLSDFFLFGLSPFVVDLKNIAGEGLEEISISANGKAFLPHHWLEELVSKGLREGGYLNDWEAKVETLDRAEGLEGLTRMKPWTDQMAMVSNRSPLSIVFQFDESRLNPFRPWK